MVFCMKLSLLPPSDVLSQCSKHLLYLCVLIWLILQAFWNWVENYADEFTRLYQRPQADMAGAFAENWRLTVPYQYCFGEDMCIWSVCVFQSVPRSCLIWWIVLPRVRRERQLFGPCRSSSSSSVLSSCKTCPEKHQMTQKTTR